MKRFLGRPGALGALFILATALLAARPVSAASGGQPVSAPQGASPVVNPQPARDSDGPPVLLGRGKKVKIGAYAGLGGAYTRLMGRDSGLVSFEAALLLDHRLSLGVAGYGFTRLPRGPRASDGTPQQFGAGYGGLAIRYSLLGDLPVYGTFGLVLGAGAVNLHRGCGCDDEAWFSGDASLDGNGASAHGEASWGDDWNAGRFDPFLFAQPEIALNLNATRWLRFGASVGYRFTGGIGRFGLSESDLNGIVAGGNIQLGWF